LVEKDTFVLHISQNSARGLNFLFEILYFCVGFVPLRVLFIQFAQKLQNINRIAIELDIASKLTLSIANKMLFFNHGASIRSRKQLQNRSIRAQDAPRESSDTGVENGGKMVAS
jgi:hypothetical protein